MSSELHAIDERILEIAGDAGKTFARLVGEIRDADLPTLEAARPKIAQQLGSLLVVLVGIALEGELDDPREKVGEAAILAVLELMYGLGRADERRALQ